MSSPGGASEGDELKVLRTLEAEAEAKLKTCGCLMQSLQKAAEALNGCGNTLQREVLQSSRPLAKSFAEEGGEEEMHPSEEYSSCIFRACESLGAALLTLAAALTGDLLTPLNELRRHMTHERKELQEELERLQQRDCDPKQHGPGAADRRSKDLAFQNSPARIYYHPEESRSVGSSLTSPSQEMLCCEAMAESVARKEKVSSELQERLQQSQEKGREKRLVRWILKKTSKAEGKLQAAAHAQTAAVEELAGRLDQLALVQSQRREAAEAFSGLLARLAQQRWQLLQHGLQSCRRAWSEGAEVLQAAFREVEEVSEAERAEPAATTAPDEPAADASAPSFGRTERPGDAAEREASPSASAPSADASPAAKARASVPPLRLADLPAAEEVSLSLNTASCTSGSSGEILNCEERHCSLSGKLDKGDPLRCAAAAGAERAVPRAAREVSLDGSECMAEDT
eukprot:g13740.t1